MHDKEDSREPSGCRRAAAHPQRNFVGHLNRQRNQRPAVTLQQVLVNLQNKIALKPGTMLPVASSCVDRKLRSRRSFNLQIKIKSHSRRVKAGAKIGGGSRQSQPQPGRVCVSEKRAQSHTHRELPFSASNTAAGVASTATASCRSPAISASLPSASS